MGYFRYIINESLRYDDVVEIILDLKKEDIDSEYGITENGRGVAMSPINDREVEKMNNVCKKYGVTPIFVKHVTEV